MQRGMEIRGVYLRHAVGPHLLSKVLKLRRRRSNGYSSYGDYQGHNGNRNEPVHFVVSGISISAPTNYDPKNELKQDL